jgi:hypothetical protein
MVPKRTIAFPFPPSRQTTILAPKRSVSLPSSPCLRPEEVCLIAEQDAPPKALTKRSVQLPTRRPPSTHEEVCPIADSPPPATTPSHPRSPPSHHPVPLQRGLSHCRVVQPVPLQAAFHRRGLSNCHLATTPSHPRSPPQPSPHPRPIEVCLIAALSKRRPRHSPHSTEEVCPITTPSSKSWHRTVHPLLNSSPEP